MRFKTHPWAEGGSSYHSGPDAGARERSHRHGSVKRLLGSDSRQRLKFGASYLDMLLEILRALERLAAELALVRLERDMDADVRSDVVALDGGGAA